MAIEQVLRLEFGKAGQCIEHVGAGWSLAETGYRWMVGPYSEVRLGPFVAGGSYLLILDVEPFIKAPELVAQHLAISLGGVSFVRTELTAAGRFGYRIPQELITDDGDLVVVFDHPDATRPCDVMQTRDSRALAISVGRIEICRVDGARDDATIEGYGGLSPDEVERRIGLAPDEFVSRFESLGENCEFGLMQRRCGAEPLSLLRFANTLLPSLLRGLDVGFEGLGERDDLTFRLEGRMKPEYIIQEQRYGLVYHTFRYRGEIDEAKFVTSEASRLKFLVRKFVEDLQGGDKILVCKRNAPLREEEILPVVAGVNVYGPNTVLWVVPADREHPPGSVHWVMPGLIQGYIDRFAPNENAHDLSLEIWLELCVNAFELWRTSGRG